MISYRAAVETDFPTPANWWTVAIPNAALPGDYAIALLASSAAGVLWSPVGGWEQIDGFSTVQFSLGGNAQSPAPLPISYACFAHFLTPADGATVSFPVIGTPTAVIGAQPGQAAGVAMCLAYPGVSRAGALRGYPLLNQSPALQLNYNPQMIQSYPPFTPVNSVLVPAVFAEAQDWLLSVLVAPSGNLVTIPANFTLRASSTFTGGVVVAIADRVIQQSGPQTNNAWSAAGGFGTPLLSEALVLWPDASELSANVELFASLDRQPASFGYLYDQQPTITANGVGYRFTVYGGTKENPQSIFAPNLLSQATLYLTTPDGAVRQQILTMSPDGRSAFCVSGANWFPYVGRNTLQLQLTWANGSVRWSSQLYLWAFPMVAEL